jgi:hypothetical protein
MVHCRPLTFDPAPFPRMSICRADLGDPATLVKACEGVDCIVHLAGVLAARFETSEWSVFATAACCEAVASLFGTVAPFTRDFIRIGMVSSAADNSRMKSELLPGLAYPTLREGLSLL